MWTEEDFVAAVLAHPLLASPTAAEEKAEEAVQMHAFFSNGSSNLVWAKWVQPGETLRVALKYRVLWPEGKDVQRDSHNA